MDPTSLARTLVSKLDYGPTPIVHLRASLLAISFWSAVLLPAVYVPLLVVGPETATRSAAVFTLLAVHVLALVVGHPYTPE